MKMTKATMKKPATKPLPRLNAAKEPPDCSAGVRAQVPWGDCVDHGCQCMLETTQSGSMCARCIIKDKCATRLGSSKDQVVAGSLHQKNPKHPRELVVAWALMLSRETRSLFPQSSIKNHVRSLHKCKVHRWYLQVQIHARRLKWSTRGF